MENIDLKNMSKYIPKEIVKQAKQIDLLTYFMNNNPSELVKKGADTYSLKTYDSVIISNGLWHRFSTNEAGKTAVDYLIKVEKMTLQEAVSAVLNKDIVAYIRTGNSNNKVPKILVIPEKSTTNKEVIEYLKNRGIDEDIINYCIQNNLIYQENKTNNVVFLGYDNQQNIRYAGCRSTNEKRIMRDAKGSSKEFSFRLLSKINNNSLHIFESSIDLLSYVTLLKIKGYDYQNQNLLALAGVYQSSKNIETGGKKLRKRYIRKDIMLNEVENEKLISDCKKSNLSYGEYFRKLLMEEQVKEKPDFEFYEVMKQLSKIGVNLNQIAHKANSTNIIDKDFYKAEAEEWHKFAREIKNKFL